MDVKQVNLPTEENLNPKENQVDHEEIVIGP